MPGAAKMIVTTTVMTWACNAKEFSQKCTRMLESYGSKLLGIDRASPVSDEDDTAHFIHTPRCERWHS